LTQRQTETTTQRDRQTDTQRERDRHTQRDRQTDTQRERDRYRQTDTDIQSDSTYSFIDLHHPVTATKTTTGLPVINISSLL